MTDATILPALQAYILRIGAEQLNFRRFMVKIYKGAYYDERCLIKISGTGDIACSRDGYEPTDKEREEIKKEISESKTFPKHILARDITGLKGRIGDEVYEFWSNKPGESGIIMVQEKRVFADGSKNYFPWTQWNDGEWRQMEPEGDLPFWKPKKRAAARIMIHEGAKAAAWVTDLLGRKGSERVGNHPWLTELRDYDHWGMIGGALAPHRTDYEELRREKPIEVLYVCDNDYPGKSALQEVSRCWNNSLKGVIFDDTFPASWDMADELPGGKFRGERYIGLPLSSYVKNATRATTLVREGKAKARAVLTGAFKEEWIHSVVPEAFIHRDQPSRLLTLGEFNSTVAPFSDVDDTARLLKKQMTNKAASLHYLPNREGGVFGHNEKGQFVNTYCAPSIKSEEGDAGPWLEFLERLIPDDGDRVEVMRWVATLIARPSVKMMYGLLLISERQGIGKTTLGEKVLAPLLGIENVSFPSESDIVDSNFNAWIAHKRLAIVNEIYAGSSAKAYNKLKSIITDKYVNVNKKHQSTYEIENWLHVYACSNSERALKLSLDDRRWFVPKLTEEVGGISYWTEFNRWLEEGGGLGIIKHWAEMWVMDNKAVQSGAVAPGSTTKEDIIDSQMSPGQMLAARILDYLKEKEPGRFVTDTAVVSYIKKIIYEDRMTSHLEKPATIRRLAKARGWSVGSVKTARWAEGFFKARVMSPDPRLSERNPETLVENGLIPFNLNDLPKDLFPTFI